MQRPVYTYALCDFMNSSPRASGLFALFSLAPRLSPPPSSLRSIERSRQSGSVSGGSHFRSSGLAISFLFPPSRVRGLINMCCTARPRHKVHLCGYRPGRAIHNDPIKAESRLRHISLEVLKATGISPRAKIYAERSRSYLIPSQKSPQSIIRC